jgi:hypothetical protein
LPNPYSLLNLKRHLFFISRFIMPNVRGGFPRASWGDTGVILLTSLSRTQRTRSPHRRAPSTPPLQDLSSWVTYINPSNKLTFDPTNNTIELIIKKSLQRTIINYRSLKTAFNPSRLTSRNHSYMNFRVNLSSTWSCPLQGLLCSENRA